LDGINSTEPPGSTRLHARGRPGRLQPQRGKRAGPDFLATVWPSAKAQAPVVSHATVDPGFRHPNDHMHISQRTVVAAAISGPGRFGSAVRIRNRRAPSDVRPEPLTSSRRSPDVRPASLTSSRRSPDVRPESLTSSRRSPAVRPAPLTSDQSGHDVGPASLTGNQRSPAFTSAALTRGCRSLASTPSRRIRARGVPAARALSRPSSRFVHDTSPLASAGLSAALHLGAAGFVLLPGHVLGLAQELAPLRGRHAIGRGAP
jgi:hypothetical protein